MAEGAVTSLAGKLAESFVGVTTQHIGYAWNWSKNVEDLEYENKKLTRMRERVLILIKTATVKGDDILPGVEEWVLNAESRITEAKKIIDGAKAKSHVSEAEEVTEEANAESHVSEAEEVTGAEETQVIDGVEGIANKILLWVGCQKAESHVSEATEVTVERVSEAEEVTGAEEIQVIDAINADSQEDIDGG